MAEGINSLALTEAQRTVLGRRLSNGETIDRAVSVNDYRDPYLHGSYFQRFPADTVFVRLVQGGHAGTLELLPDGRGVLYPEPSEHDGFSASGFWRSFWNPEGTWGHPAEDVDVDVS